MPPLPATSDLFTDEQGTIYVLRLFSTESAGFPTLPRTP